jgi:hypothetical protein
MIQLEAKVIVTTVSSKRLLSSVIEKGRLILLSPVGTLFAGTTSKTIVG